MKKKILIAVAVIAILVIGVIAFFVISDLQQEAKFNDEMLALEEIMNADELDFDAIYAKKDVIVTKGDYGVVEEAIKNYIKDTSSIAEKIIDTMNSEEFGTILTIENFEKDGKEFTESKEFITTTRETLEQCKEEYEQQFSEEKMMSYINDKGLDEYYVELYKNQIATVSEEDNQTVQESIDQVIDLLDKVEDAIDYLIENEDDWNIINGSLMFLDQDKLDEYQEILSKIE